MSEEGSVLLLKKEEILDRINLDMPNCQLFIDGDNNNSLMLVQNLTDKVNMIPFYSHQISSVVISYIINFNIFK